MTLFNLNYDIDVTQGVTQDVTQDVTQGNIDKQIKEIIKKNPNISTEEIAKGLNLSSRTVKRHIKDMLDVQFVGSGYWEINELE